MGFVELQVFYLIILQLFIGVSSRTDAADFAALSVLKSNWKNTPPGWNGTDPCGSKWEGIDCTNSRITSIILSGIGLVGTLAGDVSQLRNLQTLDLSQNKGLTGTLPPAIGNLMNLQILMLVDCNFHGLIPDTIGSMRQLVYLSLASNNFEGQIPPSFGNLINIVMLDFTENNLSGPIPVSNGTYPGLDWLVNAKHFHFSKNQLSGPIPLTLFNSSSQLVHMLFDNNQLSGSIPSTIDQLQNLEVLRVDRNLLSGKVSLNFSKLVNVSELYLANNRLSGPLPNLSGMKFLTVLDMSNNSFDASTFPQWFSTLRALRSLGMQQTQLQGPMPSSIFAIPSLQSVVLSDNALNGTLDIGKNYSTKLELIDLQNNKISGYAEEMSGNHTLLLQGNPLCMVIGSMQNLCRVEPKRLLYTTPSNNCAKVVCSSPQISSPNCKCASPIVGILHFRSVPFSDVANGTYYRRLEEAIMSAFHADVLPVDSLSLSVPANNLDDYVDVKLVVFPLEEDHFNRTAFSSITSQLNNITFINLPTYFGPYFYTLLSYNYFIGTSKPFKTAIIVGTALGGVALMLLLGLIILFGVLLRRRGERGINKFDPFASWDQEQGKGSRPEIKEVKFFTFEEIKKLTNNFSTTYLIGAGGYGKVYRGKLDNGMPIAIKRAEKSSNQNMTEFKTEIELLSRVHHRNLVNLLGFCYDKGEQMVIYEYVSNGTLRDAITGVSGIHLNWTRRLMLTLDSARGLAYLHELVNPPVIHMDVKSNNVLLDDHLVAKVSDFGLSKLIDGKVSTDISGIKGTIGYMDPEYCITNRATEKSDVYSFGVMMLEMATGKPPVLSGKHIVSEIRMLAGKPEGVYNNLDAIVDCRIISGAKSFGIERYLDLAFRCVADDRDSRPTMGEVVKEIESIIQLTDLPGKDDLKVMSNSDRWSSRDSSGRDWRTTSLYSGSYPGTDRWLQLQSETTPMIVRRAMSMPLIYTP